MSDAKVRTKATRNVVIYAFFVGIIFYISSRLLKYIFIYAFNDQVIAYKTSLVVLAFIAFYFLGKKWRQFFKILTKSLEDYHPPKR
jgi:uncharacterized membrane protein YGL010W